MGMYINSTKATWFLQDDYLIDKEVKVLLDNPEAADTLAREVANEVVDYLEGGPRARWETAHAAFDNSDFRRMVIKVLTARMNN